jgi:hypothetical protein
MKDEKQAHSAWRLLLIVTLVALAVTLVNSRLEAQSKQIASSSARTSSQEPQEKSASATQADLSRAYMNCLIEVDKTMSALAGQAKLKALQIESESQRAFCDNRRRDCLSQLDSPECRTFISEFQRTELVDNPKFGSCGSENGASTQNHFGF